MKYHTGYFESLTQNPKFGLNYLTRIPVLVSTPNKIREHIKYWLGSEGFTSFLDLTMWSHQKAPGSYQSEWVDGRIDEKYWEGKEWFEIWKAMLEGFESKKRNETNNYFILLLTPVAGWTDTSEEDMERHCLFENRTVYSTFTKERGWDPERQIVIWQANAVFYEE